MTESDDDGPLEAGTPLRAYLQSHPGGLKALALLVGVNPSTLTRAARGKQQPSYDLLLAIEKATGGELTAEAFSASCLAAKRRRELQAAA